MPHPKRNYLAVPQKQQNQQKQKANPATRGYKKQATGARTGRVHYTTVEEILEGETGTAGMFLVNQHSACVLFDSGSSHSFISQAFASKY
jgi:hypothetical protein